MNYTRHPTDPSIVVGDNGRVYAATRLPESGWQFALAWGIMDLLPPDALPDSHRLFLCGIIAGTLEKVAKGDRVGP